LKDTTGLKDRTVVHMTKKALEGKYPLTDEQRAKALGEMMRVIEDSDQDEVVIKAVGNVLKMDTFNLHAEQARKPRSSVINIALIRQELLSEDYAGLIESYRERAQLSDSCIDGEVLERRQVEDGSTLVDPRSSTG
jgi:ADP-glucose pyrophosphorylase